MTHYNNDIKGQKRFLNSCGYSYAYLNRLSKKRIYALYRACERNSC